MRPVVYWSAAIAIALVACGGSQSATEPEASTAPVVAPEPEPEPPPEPEHAYYQVFWQDIHVMTVYATPGPLRSEEPDSGNDVFSGRSSFMSVVSHYWERESDMARLIARAEDLDGFLAILAAEDYEVVEVVHEEGY